MIESMLLKWTVLFLCWHSVCGLEMNHLSYYETLSHIHLSSRVTRSSQSQVDVVKRVQFNAFQRNFHLTLRPGAQVLPKDFKARLVHKNGSSSVLPVDQSNIFTGHDTYNVNSTVHAHLEENIWSIQIIEESEIYVVEPAWRILEPFNNPHNDTMVAYRMSDLKGLSDGYKFCSVLGKHSKRNPSLSHQAPQSNRLQSQLLTLLSNGGKRVRRQKRNHGREICQIYVVGDTDLFRKRCRSNHFACLSLMIQHVRFADKVFKLSQFEDILGNSVVGFGIQIAELLLLEDYSKPDYISDVRHFNEDYHKWSADSKLNSFGTYMALSRKKYCLNHLFTEFADPKGVLGLAYVNQLCQWRNQDFFFNSGITSGTNKLGLKLPSLAISLVITHEVGHNFGANHDPDTRECAPEDNEGGKFIMWEFSLSGQHRNNLLFSKCSLKEIGRNVPGHCFRARSKTSSFCGNGIIDHGEECDAGFFGSRGDNKCCTKDCTLRVGAVCSEINHECCVDCNIASASTQCRFLETLYSCKKPSYCSGYDFECKARGNQPDGSKCGDTLSKCYNGICLNPCQQESRRLKTVDLIPCQCKENASEACMWCCFDGTDRANPGKCKPLQSVMRRNGDTCYRGTCEGGVCVQEYRPQSWIRLTSYINYVTRSKFDELLRANIVSVVIFSTLIFWLPMSLWIESLDYRERQRMEAYIDACEKAMDMNKSEIMRFFENWEGESCVDDGEYENEDSSSSGSGTMVDDLDTSTVVSFKLDKPSKKRVRHSLGDKKRPNTQL